MAKNKTINKLSINIEKFNGIINNQDAYNKKVKLVKRAATAGLITTHVVPYMAVCYALHYVMEINEKDPFVRDIVSIPEIVEVIDTSSGIHIEHTSNDVIYNNKKLEYSTGWELNEDDLYERKSILYNIDDEVCLDNTDELFSLSQDEINKMFEIDKWETVYKKNLGPEDYYYNEDGLIITNYVQSGAFSHEKEDLGDFLFNLLSYFGCSIFMFVILYSIDFKLDGFLHRIIKKLYEYKNSYTEVNNFNIAKAERLLKINQDNLDLLINEDNDDDEYKNFVLRRK